MSDPIHSHGFSFHLYTDDTQMHISICPQSPIFPIGPIAYRTMPRCVAGNSRSICPKLNSLSFSLSYMNMFLCYECRITVPLSPQSLGLKPSKASSTLPTLARFTQSTICCQVSSVFSLLSLISVSYSSSSLPQHLHCLFPGFL